MRRIKCCGDLISYTKFSIYELNFKRTGALRSTRPVVVMGRAGCPIVRESQFSWLPSFGTGFTAFVVMLIGLNISLALLLIEIITNKFGFGSCKMIMNAYKIYKMF